MKKNTERVRVVLKRLANRVLVETESGLPASHAGNALTSPSPRRRGTKGTSTRATPSRDSLVEAIRLAYV